MTFNSPRPWRTPRLRGKSSAGWTIFFAAAFFSTPVSAVGQTEGDYLYKVVTLRAAPGHFSDLLAAIQESFELDEEAGGQAPFWMRHSQGDQWDFMLIYPVGEFSSYYQPDRNRQRAATWGGSRGRTLVKRLSELTSYREEWFSRSVAVDEMARRFDRMGFFHVEMFAGLPGKRDELIEQRRMENRYYEYLGRQLNVIFVREAGTNWDAMTIGFYESLQTFASAGAQHSAEEQDEAARVAGFDNVGEIGPYLRSLLSYHHDTLGVRVP